MTRLLRHDESVPRGIDGAIHCNDIIEFDDASQWLLEDWISTPAKGGGAQYGEKKETQKSVFIFLLQLRSTLADSLAVVGVSRDLE